MKIPLIKKGNKDIEELRRLYASLQEQYNQLEENSKKGGTESEEKIIALEKRVDEFSKGLVEAENNIKETQNKLRQSNIRLQSYEADMQRSHILADTLQSPIVPSDSFEDFLSRMKQHSDKGYQKVKDYFLLEMMKKGYEGEKPFFAIHDNDSCLGIKFSVADFRTERPDIKQKLNMNIEYFPAMEFKEKQEGDPSKYLFGEFKYGNDRLMLYVSGHQPKNWSDQLKEELPVMFQAYVFGYALANLQTGKRSIAVDLMKKHGLENSSLPKEMEKIVHNGDEVLAGIITSHYDVKSGSLKK